MMIFKKKDWRDWTALMWLNMAVVNTAKNS